MKGVELYGQVRRAVYVEGLSRREAALRFGIDPRTVAKMLAFSVPPGYRRGRPPARPKLDPFVGIIDRTLEEDKGQPAKQQHTSKRIFERLRDEHGYTGGITIVKDYVHERRQRSREMFVPLRHDPGHAQVDFGEALAVIGGVERKIHFFAMDLPHSDGCLVQAYPAESSEAFCEGHRVSFEFFGGVPHSILYDNLKLAVARILGDGRRLRTGSSASCSRTICSPTASDDLGRATTKARSKGWSATRGATSWCLFRTWLASQSSTLSCWSAVAVG
jgi:transposase